MEIQIYCDALQEGEWFRKISPYFKNAKVEKIKPRGKNLTIIDNLIEYDRPDIILLINDRVVFALEKTEEVPTGHNVGQRFARIVRSIELNIPFIYFCPFVAMKHGKYANKCFINARLLKAVEKMEYIHKVPILVMNWISDKDYELIRTGAEDSELKELIDSIIKVNFIFQKSKFFYKLKEKMKIEYSKRIKSFQNYKLPPNTVKFIKTEDFIRSLKSFDVKFSDRFMNNEETLIYTIGMTSSNCRREDPFTGTQLVYDYLWCRNGTKISDRYRNLVLNIPFVTKDRWLEANPNETGKKRHLYYTVPDLIKLSDGVILTEHIRFDNPQKRLI